MWKDTLLYKQTDKDILYGNIRAPISIPLSIPLPDADAIGSNSEIDSNSAVTMSVGESTKPVPVLSQFHQIIMNKKPSVYVSSLSILTPDQCTTIIESAEQHAQEVNNGLWTTARHYDVPTTDFPMHAIPSVAPWFANDIVTKIVKPILRRHFNFLTPRELSQTQEVACDDIIIHDIFVVKYCAPVSVDHSISEQKQIQKSLPLHFDQSTHSFVIALNDCTEYTGGGTYIPDLVGQSRVDGGNGVVRIGKCVYV